MVITFLTLIPWQAKVSFVEFRFIAARETVAGNDPLTRLPLFFRPQYFERKDNEYIAAGKPNAPPEARLPSMMVGSITLPVSPLSLVLSPLPPFSILMPRVSALFLPQIGFFILAWCSYEDVHWIGAAIGCAIFGYVYPLPTN